MEDFIHWCICAIGFLGGYRKSPNFMEKRRFSFDLQTGRTRSR